MPYPPPPEPYEYDNVETEEVVERQHPRIRAVHALNGVIHAICALFAFILAVHIVLVFGGANSGNGFAQFVNEFSGAISLGLRNLFTPDSEKLRVLLNDGLAAIVWLVIGAIVTGLISRVGLPGPQRVWYRRSLR